MLKVKIVIFYYHGIWCPVYCQWKFCQFSVVETTIQLAHFCDLFLVTLVNAHTSFPCPILPYLPLYVKMWLNRISCLFMYCSYVSIGHTDIIWSIVSPYCWHTLHSLFRFSTSLLHTIQFVVPDILLLLSNLKFCFRISPRQPLELILFTINLSAYLHF
jgi:hypothetical protein